MRLVMTEFDIVRLSGGETVLPRSRPLLNPRPNETWLIPGFLEADVLYSTNS